MPFRVAASIPLVGRETGVIGLEAYLEVKALRGFESE
jgi:hypothetical protein